MIEICQYEEVMVKVYLEGKLLLKIQKGLVFDIGVGFVFGEMYLLVGQELVVVGVCVYLWFEDIVVGLYCVYYFVIFKGVFLNEMIVEIFGKVMGLGCGKGGYMYLFYLEIKFFCSGIVGVSML